MKKNFNCYICSSEKGKEYFSIDNYPAYIVPLPASYALNVVKAPLALYACDHCGHMQIPEPDSEIQRKIYEEYYNYYVVDSSEALVAQYRNPFTNFLNNLKSEYKLKNGDLLEIGCSSGERTAFFSTFGKSYTGVDPSNKIELAKNKFPQHTFIQGYFPEALPSSTFDIVISQFNLEHILDVNKFVSNIYNACNEGGLFIVQVPDANFFTRTGQPNFLAHEHIQYFIKETLSFLLQQNGFDPIAWGEEGPSLICAAKKTSSALQKISIDVESILEKVKTQATLFNDTVALPEEIIFYGVGPQLYWLLDKFKGKMDHVIVVDDNPDYQDLCLPGYSNSITTISKELIEQKQNIVLSLNKIYHEKVLNKIKAFKVSCNVILNENNSWIKKDI
ncbi:MAG: methyltransferase domain-containing protein [Ferruginibacter sp.]